MENKMDISEKLLRVLEIKKCNQKDLAEKIGVSEKSVGRWLAGHTITQTNLKKISLKLDISMRWLTEKDYEGPQSKKAEWAYNVSKRKFSHQEAAGIYGRIYEIMKALDIKNPAKLVALANINSRLEDNHYFLGSIPDPRDIEKISMVTGYNKDYIIDGTPPRLNNKALVFQNVNKAILTGEGTPSSSESYPNVVVAHPIPIVGTVPAGFPQMAPEEDQIIDYISIPDVPRNSFAMIVSGESMSPTIRGGDYAVFTLAGGGDIKSGDPVIVLNEWGELLLKRFRKKDEEIVLTSDNPEYPVVKPNNHYKIVGKVIKVIRDIKF